jgi:hypothetical protein
MATTIRKPSRTKFRMFEGYFTDRNGNPTTAVRWSTAAVALPDGPVEGRLRVAPRTTYGIGEAVSSLPERAQTTLELINGDRALGKYLVGTDSGNLALEYRGDSFLNLRGRIVACYVKDDGSIEKHPLTPTLRVSGAVEFNETTIRVPMSTDDGAILGRPTPIVRVGWLQEAELLEAGDCYRLGQPGTYAFPEWGEFQAEIRENLDTVIPYAYGRVAIPAIRVSGDDNNRAVLFVSKHRPSLADAEKWMLWKGTYSPATLYRPQSLTPALLWSAKVRVRDEEDRTHDLWVVALTAPTGFTKSSRWTLDGAYLLPTSANRLSAGSSPSRKSSSPVAIARYIVEDLSRAGVTAIDPGSFAAATKALQVPGACGGLVTGEGALGELLTLIGQPWGLSWWMGLDDRLHVGTPGQWTADDRAALTDPDTPRITAHDFADGAGQPGAYSESIPANPEERGAAARKVWIEWTDRQLAAWPADHLPRWAPGATEIPIPEETEVRLSGAWIYPGAGVDVLAAHGQRRTFPARRVTIKMHDWIADLERGSLVLFTLPRAVGAGGAQGYTDRVLRLEHTADDAREYCVARFEDLGSVAAQRPAVYADIDDWTLFTAATHASTLSVTAGSDIVTLGKPWGDPAKLVGMHLSTPGAHRDNRRIARRIVEGIDSTHFRVEFPFQVSETLPAAAPGTATLACPWAILYSQETRGGYSQTTYLTCADESTGAFRDGTPGFTVSAG